MVHFVQRGVSHIHAVVHSLRPHDGQSRQFAVQVVEQQFEQFCWNTDVLFGLSVLNTQKLLRLSCKGSYLAQCQSSQSVQLGSRSRLPTTSWSSCRLCRHQVRSICRWEPRRSCTRQESPFWSSPHTGCIECRWLASKRLWTRIRRRKQFRSIAQRLSCDLFNC